MGRDNRRRVRYEDRRPYNSGRNKAFDRDRQRGRMRRKRQRLIKALIAWAVCIFLVILVAMGTFRLVVYLTSAKQRELRDQGIEQMAQGDYQGAITSFDQALEAVGKETGAMAEDILCYRAEAEYQVGDYEAALYTFSLLIQQDQDQPEYYYMSSLCSSAQEQAVQAVDFYRQGQELAKDEHSQVQLKALLAAGNACVNAGQYDQAMDLYTQAIEGGLTDGQIDNQMGLCQMAQEKYEDAADTFDQALTQARSQTEPDTALLKELSFNRAVCSEYMQQYQEALELFESYVQEFGTDQRAEHEIQFLESR